jgi:transposase
VNGPQKQKLEKQIKALQMKKQGFSASEIASAFNVTTPCVYQWFKDDLDLVQRKLKQAVLIDKTSDAVMCDMYAKGYTLEHIASKFLISREKVRKIVKKYGVNKPAKDNSARQAQISINKRLVLQRKEERVKKLWGITLAQYEAIKTEFGSADNPASPFRKYTEQRKNARIRKVGWDISFADWWRIWQTSGKWALRGRGKGYCMGRFGDKGPYKVGNVEIILCAQNTSDYQNKNKV